MIAIQEYLASMHDWSPNSKTTARRHLTYWQEMLNGTSLAEIGITDFEEWKVQRFKSESMAYNSLWAMKGYLRWLGEKDHPLLCHKVTRHEPPLQPYITLDEVETLIEACDQTTPKGLQDATIVYWLWGTWARADSTVRVTLDRIDLKNQEAVFPAKQNKKTRWHTAPIDLDLKDQLELWLPVRAEIAKPQIKTLFINIRMGTSLTYWGLNEILQALAKKTGIDKRAHAFRRGGARQHANEGGNDRQGMAKGGWRSYSMYKRYTRGVEIEAFKQKRWRKNGK